MTQLFRTLIFLCCSFLFMNSCKKTETIEGTTITDNDSPYYDGVPTVQVQNYVNRIFIDLIGREPLDTEMEFEVNKLRANDLSFEARDTLITKLLEDETFLDGDTSYKHAYYQRTYELFKVRMLEGASDADIIRERNMIAGNLIRDSIAGDYYRLALNLRKIEKLNDVLFINKEYRDGNIEIQEAFARLLDNAVYDKINMNTFNFLNASFNDLFSRYPTAEEFNIGFDVIEYDIPGNLFGEYAANKGDFIQVLVNSEEFDEGIIRWTYGTLLAREPTSEEVYEAMSLFKESNDLQQLQLSLLRTDEYANFN